MKLLIIHGPNMNLLGLFSKNRLTLDKLNKSIRKFANSKNIDVKILQTNDEAKYVTYIQRNRNKVDAYILNLNSLLPKAFVIKSTLEIIKPKYLIVENSTFSKEFIDLSIFDKNYLIQNDDFKNLYNEALLKLSR